MRPRGTGPTLLLLLLLLVPEAAPAAMMRRALPAFLAAARGCAPRRPPAPPAFLGGGGGGIGGIGAGRTGGGGGKPLLPSPGLRSARPLSAAPPPRGDDDDAGGDGDGPLYSELRSLSAEIRRHDRLYYGEGAGGGEISDGEYDALARREEEICLARPDLAGRLGEETGLGILATRHGGRVGPVLLEEDGAAEAEAASRARVRRSHLPSNPMRSLDNALDEDGVARWLGRLGRLCPGKKEDEEDEEDGGGVRIELLAEPKMDGLSLSLRYELASATGEDGAPLRCTYRFVWAATRGDGTRGEDVTEGVRPLLRGASGAKGGDNGDGEAEAEAEGRIPSLFAITLDGGGRTGSPPAVVEVRGEVVLPRSAFRELRDAYDRSAAEAQALAEVEATVGGDGDGDGAGDGDGPNLPLLPTRFSNARNAASGILLRHRETADGADAGNTRQLRARLRFHAYDAAVSQAGPDSEGGGAGTRRVFGDDAASMRRALEGCGFGLPRPTASATVVVRAGGGGAATGDKGEEEEEVGAEGMADVLAFHRRLMESRDGGGDADGYDQDYDVDGAVYKLSSLSLRDALGASSRAPRWAIAHKFPVQSAVTAIRDVDVQVGRTGALTPVAILEPVEIAGVSVGRASLHNFWFAAELLSDGREARVRRGSDVVVGRAGDVIPQVLRQLPSGGGSSAGTDESEWISLRPPSKCPSCGSHTVFETVEKKSETTPSYGTEESEAIIDASDGARRSGQVLRCSAPQLLCPPRALGALKHAFSRRGLDVSGLSEARLQQLLDEGIIKVPADLFRIARTRIGDDGNEIDQLASLPGWGTKSSQNLISATQAVASNGITLATYIYSLGIRHIGAHTSKLIASSYGTASAFLQDIDAASELQNDSTNEEMTDVRPFQKLVGDESTDSVKGIGPVMIDSLIDFSKQHVLVQAAKDLFEEITIHDEAMSLSESSAARPLEGLTVVFTGAVPGMSRLDAQRAAIELGASKTPGSLSGSTNLVVEGEKGGKKANKAKELGIKVMAANEFLRIMEDNHS